MTAGLAGGGRPCPVCLAGHMAPFRVVEGVGYDRCLACGSIVAEEAFLARVAAGEARRYDEDYWTSELAAARERGYGNSVPRVAELFFYARRPLRRLLDVSAGGGFLLDAITVLLPSFGTQMRAIEPFPPPEPFRTRHPGYQIGFLHEIDGAFDAGTCIEVIEHIAPEALWGMVRDLARVAAPGSVWYFNSAQPESDFVQSGDYLDPHRRGHIASYSLAGLRPMFATAGFALQPLPGRDWAFLAIRDGEEARDAEGVLQWVWNPLPENMAALASEPFGALMRTIGTEAAVAYAMSAIADARAKWALGLEAELARRPSGSTSIPSHTGHDRPEDMWQLSQALAAAEEALREALATRARVPRPLLPLLRAWRRWRSGS